MLKTNNLPVLQHAMTEARATVGTAGLEGRQLTIVQPGQADLPPIK
jgi:hypothetical protein